MSKSDETVDPYARFRKWSFLCVAGHLLIGLASAGFMIYSQYLWPWGPWNIYPFGPRGHPASEYYQAPFYGAGGAYIVYAAAGCTILTVVWAFLICPCAYTRGKHRLSRFLEFVALILWCTALGFLIPNVSMTRNAQWQRTWVSNTGTYTYAEDDADIAAVTELMKKAIDKAYLTWVFAGLIIPFIVGSFIFGHLSNKTMKREWQALRERRMLASEGDRVAMQIMTNVRMQTEARMRAQGR